MSDEFDPEIERLFARTPAMPDADLFAARIEQRLRKGSAFRALALTTAGVVGGAVAVRESLSLDFRLSDAGAETARAVSDTASGDAAALSGGAGDALQGLFGQWGVADAAQTLLPTGSLGGMQLFWIATAAVIALAAAGIVRLSQEI